MDTISRDVEEMGGEEAAPFPCSSSFFATNFRSFERRTVEFILRSGLFNGGRDRGIEEEEEEEVPSLRRRV